MSHVVKSLNADFEGVMPGADQLIYDVTNEIAKGNLPEPKLQGDTTFGVSVEWINWYCKVNNTAIWKARKEGKRRLQKLKGLQARFNK